MGTAQQVALIEAAGQPLFSFGHQTDTLERMQTASLFAGPSGLLAHRPRATHTPPGPLPTTRGAPVARLRDLIAMAEAGPMGYDAVQYGARIKPGKRPTDMTIGEIFAWIKATPGQPHAIGRYQIIPATLRHLVRELRVPDTARFDAPLQDRMATLLLQEAGLDEFLSGQMDRVAFMNRIAKVWAGLPTSNGRSHYHGYAGNKAVLSWARFDTEMARIFPDSVRGG